MDGELLEGQLAYYRARAEEYDDWFLRRGRHDRGPEWNRRWFSELEEIRQELGRFGPAGHVLELACGTGLWTAGLARHATSVTAVDASPEVLGINHARLRDAGHETAVRYVEADLFAWHPDAAYDAIFFGFWLSHVPPERFDAFWGLVRSALRPGGRAFFVDSLGAETPDEKGRRSRDPQDYTTLRQVDDGREFRIVKVFYDPEELSSRLRDLGWDVRVRTTDNHILYGFGTAA